MTQTFDPNSVRTVIFDVIGTLVDEVGSLRAEARQALREAGLDEGDGEPLADAWLKRFETSLSETVAGQRAWEREDDHRLRTLHDVVEDQGVMLDSLVLTRLASAGRRLRPWPHAAYELASVASLRPTCALTNASFPQILEISSRAGLGWHAVLSTELAHTYKPSPAAYELASHHLQVDPACTLFVAAHGWDLRGAAGSGFQTAYVPRPHAEGPRASDEVTLRLGSLGDLAALLGQLDGSRAPDATTCAR